MKEYLEKRQYSWFTKKEILEDVYNKLTQNDEFKRTFGNDFYIKEFLRQYNIFTKYKIFTQNVKCEVYNTSSESILKIFPKVKFESLFQ